MIISIKYFEYKYIKCKVSKISINLYKNILYLINNYILTQDQIFQYFLSDYQFLITKGIFRKLYDCPKIVLRHPSAMRQVLETPYSVSDEVLSEIGDSVIKLIQFIAELTASIQNKKQFTSEQSNILCTYSQSKEQNHFIKFIENNIDYTNEIYFLQGIINLEKQSPLKQTVENTLEGKDDSKDKDEDEKVEIRNEIRYTLTYKTQSTQS